MSTAISSTTVRPVSTKDIMYKNDLKSWFFHITHCLHTVILDFVRVFIMNNKKGYVTNKLIIFVSKTKE